MIKWFKKLLRIVKHYDDDMQNFTEKYVISDEILSRHEIELDSHRRNIIEAQQLIKDRTEVHADIHTYNPNDSRIIVIGNYKNTDYIEIFPVGNGQFNNIVDELKHQSKYGNIKRVDALPSIKEFIMHDTGEY